MPFQNPNQWVRTIKVNAHLGFRYEPGSGMKARGLEADYYTLNHLWLRLHRDAIRVAKNRFGAAVEVVTKKPKGMD